jgi:hypothetical protein
MNALLQYVNGFKSTHLTTSYFNSFAVENSNDTDRHRFGTGSTKCFATEGENDRNVLLSRRLYQTIDHVIESTCECVRA